MRQPKPVHQSAATTIVAVALTPGKLESDPSPANDHGTNVRIE